MTTIHKYGSMDANAMPTQKKLARVKGGIPKPYLSGENAVKPTIARLSTVFIPFICSSINANAMPTQCQRKTVLSSEKQNGCG